MNHSRKDDCARAEKLRGLANHLAASIKGQDHVLSRLVSALQRGELGVTHSDRPKGSFLFIGPTGVGKTETTKAFSRYLFGTDPITFDMSEYQLHTSVDKLIGSGRNDPGLLGRAMRGLTKGTILFDEIEKAHMLVLDLFLQILWEGRVTLATGETVNFCPFFIVFTSNIGSAETMRMQNAPHASLERVVHMRLGDALRPELIGRISDIVVFSRLDYAAQREICENLIAAECERLARLGYFISVAKTALEFFVREGYSRLLGARPMRERVERHLQECVASDLLADGPGSGQIVWDESASKLSLLRS